jgi:hypothetical protein
VRVAGERGALLGTDRAKVLRELCRCAAQRHPRRCGAPPEANSLLCRVEPPEDELLVGGGGRDGALSKTVGYPLAEQALETALPSVLETALSRRLSGTISPSRWKTRREGSGASHPDHSRDCISARLCGPRSFSAASRTACE